MSSLLAFQLSGTAPRIDGDDKSRRLVGGVCAAGFAWDINIHRAVISVWEEASFLPARVDTDTAFQEGGLAKGSDKAVVTSR